MHHTFLNLDNLDARGLKNSEHTLRTELRCRQRPRCSSSAVLVDSQKPAQTPERVQDSPVSASQFCLLPRRLQFLARSVEAIRPMNLVSVGEGHSTDEPRLAR